MRELAYNIYLAINKSTTGTLTINYQSGAEMLFSNR